MHQPLTRYIGKGSSKPRVKGDNPVHPYAHAFYVPERTSLVPIPHAHSAVQILRFGVLGAARIPDIIPD